MLGALFVLGLLSACAATPGLETPPVETIEPTPSETPDPSAEPTATIVWFPPTATFTPMPTASAVVTPTLEVEVARGELLFSDDFSEPELWSLGRNSAGSAAISKNRLTLAVSEEEGYLYSLRQQPELTNFYAEITASANLCLGGDEYGLLVRATGSSEFYRFSVTCDGQVRLDRYTGGRASSPYEPSPGQGVPPGAPSTLRMGVLAAGKELQFFINDEHQFTVQDPAIESGHLGVFARAAGDTPVTINFTDLSVYRPAP